MKNTLNNSILFFKRKYWSTWPDEVYWEVYVYEPEDMIWEPRTASSEVCPARRYFPEKAKDIPLSELSTSIVEQHISLAGPFEEVSCCNAKTYASWLEVGVTEERLKALSANPDVALCILVPTPPPPAPTAPTPAVPTIPWETIAACVAIACGIIIVVGAAAYLYGGK